MTCKRIRIGEKKKVRLAGKHPRLIWPRREMTPLEKILDNYWSIRLHAYRSDIFSLHTNGNPAACMNDMIEKDSKLKEAFNKYTDSFKVIKVTEMGGKKHTNFKFNVVFKVTYKTNKE